LCLWRTVGWQRSNSVDLNLGNTDLKMSRPTARKALYALEGAGLVTVERPPGRRLRVAVLDVPDKPTPRKRKKR
jgi:hypothetical protein